MCSGARHTRSDPAFVTARARPAAGADLRPQGERGQGMPFPWQGHTFHALRDGQGLEDLSMLPCAVVASHFRSISACARIWLPAMPTTETTRCTV